MAAYAMALEALSDGTRRQVLESLRSGPRSVSAIAAGLPVSRPAVSQHLRVLRDADLVRVETAGRYHHYSINHSGLETLRAYLDTFWNEVLDAYARAAAETSAEPI